MTDTRKEETLVLVTATGAAIGNIVHYPAEGGWRFLPATTSHRPSRKVWPTANKAIPEWAFKLSNEMLTVPEFRARQSSLTA